MSLHNLRVITDRFRQYRLRPITQLEWRHGTTYACVINVKETPDCGWMDLYNFCVTQTPNFIVRRTAWNSINVFLETLDDAEHFLDSDFEPYVRYIKAILNNFHLKSLKENINKHYFDRDVIIEDKAGAYYSKYDAKVELYTWPFTWQDTSKASQALDFIKANCEDVRIVRYQWGDTVYLNHSDYTAIEPFLIMSLGQTDKIRRALRLYVRILEDK